MTNFQRFLELYKDYRLPVFALLAVLIAFFFFRSRKAKGLEDDESLDQLDESINSVEDQERINKVLELEKDRTQRRYKPGWIYHKCKENGLLPELQKLRQDGVIENPFSVQMPTESPSKVGIKLVVELVPESCWFSNLRSVLSPEKWKALKSLAYKKANYRCEICGGRGPQWPVEAHEVWEYFDDIGEQRLKSIVALCPSCHEVKHFGLAKCRRRGEIALMHFMQVNGLDRARSTAYIDAQFDIWYQRSQKKWRTDLKALLNYGIMPEEVTRLELSAHQERQANQVNSSFLLTE